MKIIIESRAIKHFLSKQLLLCLLFTIAFQKDNFGQKRLVVKDNITGEIRKIKPGKLIGLRTRDNKNVEYKSGDTYPKNDYWYIKSFTDSTITIAQKRTAETKDLGFNNITNISFKRNENTGSPLALAAAGIVLVVASPFVGIEKGDYNYSNAAITFGAGLGALTIVYLTTRNRDLRDYTIVGTAK